MDPVLPFRTLSPAARKPKAATLTNKISKLSLKTWNKRKPAKNDKENNPPVQIRKETVTEPFSELFDPNLLTSDESSASNCSDIGQATARQFSVMSLNTQESRYALPIAESTRCEIPEFQPSCADLKITTLYTAHSDNSSSSTEYYTAHPGLAGCDDSIVCLSDASSEVVGNSDKQNDGTEKRVLESVIISSDESDCDQQDKNVHHNRFSSMKKMEMKKLHETVDLGTDSEDNSNVEEQGRICNVVIPASPLYSGSVVDGSVGDSTDSSMERHGKVKTCDVLIPPSPRRSSGSSLISEESEGNDKFIRQTHITSRQRESFPSILSSSVVGKPKNIVGSKALLEGTERSSFGSIVSSSVIGDAPVAEKKKDLKPSRRAVVRENSDETQLNESSWKEDFRLVMPESSTSSEEQTQRPGTITKQKYDDIARWLFFGQESSGGSSRDKSLRPEHHCDEQQVEEEQSPQILKHPQVNRLSVVKRSSFGSESEENFNALMDSVRKKRNNIKKKINVQDDSFINDNSDESPALLKYHSDLTKSIRSEVNLVKKSVKTIKKRQILCNVDDSDDSDEWSQDRQARQARPFADSKKSTFKSDRKYNNPLSSTDDSESEPYLPKKGNRIIFSDDSDTDEKRRTTSKPTDVKKQKHPKKTLKNVIKSSEENSSTSSRSDAGLVAPVKPKKSIWRKSVDLSESSTSGNSNSTSSPELKPTKGRSRKIQTEVPQTVLRKLPPVKPKHLEALKSPQTPRSPVRTFLSSLSGPTHQTGVRDHPEAFIYNKNFKAKKEELTRRLFKLFNREVFECKLPQDMVLEWNPRLVRTAGLCYCKLVKKSGVTDRSAKIALSTKVITSPDRLRDTLIHEMCHAAVWLLNNVSGGHGPYWKAWACKAMRRFPELPLIERCHSYHIETKFTYKCTVCGYSFGRHSKSLNLEKKRCGHCYGTFEVFVNTKKQNQQEKILKAPKAPSAFALFVKENYGNLKQENSGLKHGDIMKKLGEKFASLKLKQSDS